MIADAHLDIHREAHSTPWLTDIVFTQAYAVSVFHGDHVMSSAAFLLEMARVLARKGNNVTYWLVFFDGEEALQRWSNHRWPVRQSALRPRAFRSRDLEPGQGGDLG